MWEIYSVGNAAFLIDVFNGLARLWSTGDIYVLLSTALVIGLIWNSLQWATNQEKMPFPAKGFILSIIFVVGLLGPQSLVDVRITSKRDYSFQEINNVPLLPALGGWLISNSGTAIADIMAKAFSTVGIDTWEALSPIQHFVGLSDINFSDMCTPNPLDKSINVCKSFNHYLEDCFTTANLISPSSTNPIDPVLNAKPADILNELKVTNPNLYTLSYLAAGNDNGEHMKCEAAWNKLSGYMKSTQFTDNMQKSLAAQGSDLSKVTQFLTQYSTQGVIPAAESSLDLANAAFLSSIFNNYFTNSPYGEQVSRAMFDTVRQRQLANASKKEYWMENAEVMQSFFEALTVFLTPFLGLVLAVSGQGLMAVGQYFAAWMFVQLWSVMIVLVNLFTALAMTNRFNDAVAAGKSQFSLTAIDSQFATANSYISIAGMLYTFIPAICVFVLYRGVHAMQGMAKQAMADPNINAQRLSPDTGATVQSGNVSFGNQNSTLETNTGRHLSGDTISTTSLGDFSVGSSMGNSAATGATQLKSAASSLSQNAQSALDNIFSSSTSGSYEQSAGNTSSASTQSLRDYASNLVNNVSEGLGISKKDAQQLLASGAIGVSAGGGLSLGGGHILGAKLGGEVKASAQLSSSSDQTSSQSFLTSVQGSESKRDAVNAALSKIATVSDLSSFSDTGAVSDSARQAASYARQAQAADQQSAMLTNMSTQSAQISSSKKLDFAGLAADLRNQDLGSYVSQHNPELWERMQNTQIGNQSGAEWLQQKEVGLLEQRSSKSNNAGGEARAGALMEFAKQLDSINVNESGSAINVAKERQDANTNKDIFSMLAQNNVTNADAFAEMYGEKAKTMDAIELTTDKIDSQTGRLNTGAPTLTDANTYQQQFTQAQGAATGTVGSAKAIAEEGTQAVIQQNKANREQLDIDGNALTGGVAGVTPETKQQLAQGSDRLDASINSSSQLLDTIRQVPNELGNLTKSNSEVATNNYITQLASTEDGAKWVGENMNGDTGKGLGLLSNFNGNPTEVMNRGLQVPGQEQEKYKSLLKTLDNPELMSGLLGADGKGSDLAKSIYSPEDLHKLSELNDWYQGYTQSNSVFLADENGVRQVSENAGGEKAINNALKLNDAGSSVAANSNPILNAISNDGMVNSFNSNNAASSLHDADKAANALGRVLNGDNVDDIIKEDSILKQNYQSGIKVNLTQADHDNNSNNISDIRQLAQIISPSLSQDKQELLKNAVAEFDKAVPAIDGQLQNDATENKDNIYSARLAGAQGSENQSFTSNQQKEFNALIDSNMQPEHVRYDAKTKQYDAEERDISDNDLSAIKQMYESAKPYISHESQGKIEADLKIISEKDKGHVTPSFTNANVGGR